jgi:hypothetical protein
MSSLRHRLENIRQLSRMPGQSHWLKRAIQDCIDETQAVIHHLHPTYVMTRARVSPFGEPFRNTQELSYPPLGVSSQGRANGTGRSLFYAASCERRKLGRSARNEQVTDPMYGLSIALYETLFELRKNVFSSAQPQTVGPEEEKIFHVSDGLELELTDVSYGYWQAIDKIDLIKVMPLREYDFNSFDAFQARTILTSKYNDPIVSMKNMEFWEFMSVEFAKLGIKEDDPIDYRISSIVAEKFIDAGYDGVSFPSVRSGGWGINFAISPSAVDRKLQCFRVNRALIRVEDGKLVVKEIETQKVNIFDQNAPF